MDLDNVVGLTGASLVSGLSRAVLRLRLETVIEGVTPSTVEAIAAFLERGLDFIGLVDDVDVDGTPWTWGVASWEQLPNAFGGAEPASKTAMIREDIVREGGDFLRCTLTHELAHLLDPIGGSDAEDAKSWGERDRECWAEADACAFMRDKSFRSPGITNELLFEVYFDLLSQFFP
jgi:hypothetical protein